MPALALALRIVALAFDFWLVNITAFYPLFLPSDTKVCKNEIKAIAAVQYNTVCMIIFQQSANSNPQAAMLLTEQIYNLINASIGSEFSSASALEWNGRTFFPNETIDMKRS